MTLDIQLFAEGETTDETKETTTAEPTATEESPEPEAESTEPEAIPAELDGLPEDLARETMKEVTAKEQPASAEPENSDNKPSESGRNTSIPYPRFKEQVDKSNALEQQLNAYRQRYGELTEQANANQAQQAPPQQQVPPPEIPPMEQAPMQITPEISKRIDEIVNQRALTMTGMTQEEVQSLQDYGDEDNAKLTTYENARAMARSMVMGEISDAVKARTMKARELLMEHQRMVNDFNSFYQQAAADPTFKAVQGYATGDYFNAMSPIEQGVIRDAYTRIERQTASPQDILLIKRYFNEAKASYIAQQTPPAPQPVRAAKPTMPRAGDVDGSASSPAEGVTVESLAKMLDEQKFSEIPEQYQKMLLGL